MIIALATLVMDFDRTPTIIAAQAVTVVGAPLVAGVLLWLSNSKDIMGAHANGPITKTFAGIGLVLLIAMAGRTAFIELPKQVKQYREKNAAWVTQPQVEIAHSDRQALRFEVARFSTNLSAIRNAEGVSQQSPASRSAVKHFSNAKRERAVSSARASGLFGAWDHWLAPRA
jgi:hypothetical protein